MKKVKKAIDNKSLLDSLAQVINNTDESLVIQKVSKHQEPVKVNFIPKNTEQSADSLTLFIYEELKAAIDEHVILHDIKYNEFYQNVISYFYKENKSMVINDIDNEKPFVKIHIICDKTDKINIKLFAKKHKTSYKAVLISLIENYLMKQP